jgi:hypothetical protein
MAKQETMALAPRPQFAVLQQGAQSVAQALRENLDGEQVGPNDLDRIKIPAGGGTFWSIPTIDGETEAKDFNGIIVAFRTVRSFWRSEFTGEGVPPDCFSDDGIVGHGDPGVQCAACPFNQWGSAEKNTGGKACKERRLVFVLREGDFLPVVVALPPASIAPFKKYLMRLASQGVMYYGAVTRFSLEKDKNSGGITFSKAALSVAEKLDTEATDGIRQYAESIKPLLARVRDEEAGAVDAVVGVDA